MQIKQSLRYFKLPILAAILLLAVSSCNRKTVESVSSNSFESVKAKEVVQMMDTLTLEFDELKARFKIKADMNGNSKSFNADLRWKSDEQIWMSFSIFGFEGVRALFTRDSVKIINKLEKQYYHGTYVDLEQISQVPLSFDEIENLFLGKLTGIQDKKPIVRFKGDDILLDLEDKEYEAQVKVDRKTLSIQHFLITSLLDSRSVDVTLSDYQLIEQKNWANNRSYKIKSGSNYLNIEATSQKVVLNEKLEYPFYVSEKYSIIPLRNFR